jgi:hypothetical protein
MKKWFRLEREKMVWDRRHVAFLHHVLRIRRHWSACTDYYTLASVTTLRSQFASKRCTPTTVLHYEYGRSKAKMGLEQGDRRLSTDQSSPLQFLVWF